MDCSEESHSAFQIVRVCDMAGWRVSKLTFTEEGTLEAVLVRRDMLETCTTPVYNVPSDKFARLRFGGKPIAYLPFASERELSPPKPRRECSSSKKKEQFSSSSALNAGIIQSITDSDGFPEHSYGDTRHTR